MDSVHLLFVLVRASGVVAAPCEGAFSFIMVKLFGACHGSTLYLCRNGSSVIDCNGINGITLHGRWVNLLLTLFEIDAVIWILRIQNVQRGFLVKIIQGGRFVIINKCQMLRFNATASHLCFRKNSFSILFFFNRKNCHHLVSFWQNGKRKKSPNTYFYLSKKIASISTGLSRRPYKFHLRVISLKISLPDSVPKVYHDLIQASFCVF